MQRYQFNYNVLKRVRLEKVIDPEVVETAGMFLEEEYTARTDPVRDPATKNNKRVQRRLNSNHAEDKKRHTAPYGPVIDTIGRGESRRGTILYRRKNFRSAKTNETRRSNQRGAKNARRSNATRRVPPREPRGRTNFCEGATFVVSRSNEFSVLLGLPSKWNPWAIPYPRNVLIRNVPTGAIRNGMRGHCVVRSNVRSIPLCVVRSI